MSIQKELDRVRDEQRLNVPAKRILEKIQNIPADIGRLQRRWFWELLQNASDSNEEVQVELELHRDKVVFKHNGKPFRLIDTENLIAPDSGKDENDKLANDVIGQFGTGFISTHVLAARIRVEGIMQSDESHEYYSFAFDLDRTGYTDKDKLKESISKSSSQLRASLSDASHLPGEFETSFTYFIESPLPDIRPGQAIKPGVEHIIDILPYTLAFMPKVKGVTISNYGTDIVGYSSQHFSQERLGDSFSVRIQTRHGGSTEIECVMKKFITESCNEASVVVEIKNERVEPFPKNLTKLFCSLPMIGTEEFPFPMAMNSSQFVPKTERDGISLSYNSKKNRSIIIAAAEAYQGLITKLSRDRYGSMYNVCRLATYAGEYDEKKWFKNEVIDPIKYHLLETELVPTANGYIKLEEVKIPFFNSDDLKKGQLQNFYNLCADFMPEAVPLSEDFNSWFESLDFNLFKGCKYELSSLAKEVDSIGHLDVLIEQIPDAKQWLHDFISLVLEIDDGLLDRYRVIPNQCGSFLRRKDNVYFDEELDELLVEIYDTITNEKYREYLLDPFFHDIPNVLDSSKSKCEQDLAKDVDDAFSSYSEDSRSSPSFQTGLQLIFKWFSDSGKHDSELKELFKWFYGKRSQLFLETFDDAHRDKVLSIAESGKLQSLSIIAKSKFTDAEIQSFAENLEDLNALNKVLIEVPNGMDKLLEYAGILMEDEREFQFKKEIGEKVEKVFIEALKTAKIEAKIIHQGWGSHDFEIVNELNEKSYFIELKSYSLTSENPFRLAVSQAEKAKAHSESFSLVTIPRPPGVQEITVDYIRKHTHSTAHISGILADALEEYYQLQRITANKRLHITFREAIRVNVDRNRVLEKSLDFEGLIRRIVDFIG